MNTQELLQQLRAKGWGDLAIAQALEMDTSSIYRWRLGFTRPHAEGVITRELQRLLRRRGPPRKGVAGVGPATPSTASA
jgi:hypothetical protein